MLTIHIKDELETALINIAKNEHLQPEQLVKKLIAEYTYSNSNNKEPVLVSDIIDDLPTLQAFSGNPVDIQKEMRDEWD